VPAAAAMAEWADNSPVEGLEPHMIELTLPTMTCNHCVKTVTATVQKVDANAKLQVDLPTHKVQIESGQPADAFRSALADEGYAPA
jgi:copper chaperone